MPCARRAEGGGARQPACAQAKKARPLGPAGLVQPGRSVRPEHLLEGLACVEHAVLAGVPLDGRELAGRKAYGH